MNVDSEESWKACLVGFSPFYVRGNIFEIHLRKLFLFKNHHRLSCDDYCTNLGTEKTRNRVKVWLENWEAKMGSINLLIASPLNLPNYRWNHQKYNISRMTFSRGFINTSNILTRFKGKFYPKSVLQCRMFLSNFVQYIAPNTHFCNWNSLLYIKIL